RYDIQGRVYNFSSIRTCSMSVEKRDFIEEPSRRSSYTHVVADTNLQVCAIGAKRRLSPRIAGIARQLATLLMNSQEVGTRNIEIEILPLNDPTTFIEFLQTAYAISSFSISFRRPNPFEADEDIHKPLQRYLQQLNGEHGKATFTGEQL